MAPVGKVALITDLPCAPPCITLLLAFSRGSYPGRPIMVCHCQIKSFIFSVWGKHSVYLALFPF